VRELAANDAQQVRITMFLAILPTHGQTFPNPGKGRVADQSRSYGSGRSNQNARQLRNARKPPYAVRVN